MTSVGFKLNTSIFKRLNISLVANGKKMFTFEVKDGTLKIFADSSLHERDGLVGMCGAFFQPTLLSTSGANLIKVFGKYGWRYSLT